MAHIPASTAIFSPSVARLAAASTKDWNYVDSWLSSKFHGRTPPSFERNPSTLKVLLALATLNEQADEERDTLARVEADALQELKAANDSRSAGSEEGVANVRERILDAIEDGLSHEGRTALDAMASAAVELGVAYPEPETLGGRVVELQAQFFELEQMTARIGLLQRYIEAEAASMETVLKELEGNEYQPAPDLAKQNLDMQRKITAFAAKLPDMKEKAAAVTASVGMPNPTIEQVKKEEDDYLELLGQKKQLEAQVESFQGLPPDTDLARRELEKLRAELRSVTKRRDAVFEGLVERETPRKRA